MEPFEFKAGAQACASRGLDMCARRIGSSAFYEKHPYCCFCGGSVGAETVEHAPPRVLFRDKKRLKGLEFPACKRCNNGTSDLDQVAALFCLTMGAALNPDMDSEYWEKIFLGVKNNSPEVIDYLARDVEPHFWDLGERRETLIRSKINRKLFHHYLNPWAAKLTYAIWYEVTGTAIDEEIVVYINWLTNEKIMRDGVPEGLFDIAPHGGALQNGKLESSDQFMYRSNLNAIEKLGFVMLETHQSGVACAFIMPKHHRKERYLPTQRGSLFATSPEKGIEAWSPYSLGFMNCDLDEPV